MEEKVKKPANLRTVAAWYHGNYCCMRCLREDADFERLSCYKKIREMMQYTGEQTIMHKDFIILVRDVLKICDTRNFKKWESSDCPVCKAFGIPNGGHDTKCGDIQEGVSCL